MLQDRETLLAIKIVLAAAAVFVLIWAIIELAPIISLFVIAFLIVYSINPLVDFLVSIRVKPIFASTIASLIVLFLVILFFYLLIPGLIGEMRDLVLYLTTEFILDLPVITAELQELDERFNLRLTETFVEYTDQFIRQAPANIQQLLRNLTAFSMALVNRAWLVLVLVFLAFYLVQDIGKVRRNLTLLFPQIYKENVIHLLAIIDEKVGAYVRGTLVKCLFVGFLTWLGLFVMEMPFALMLGILAGLLNIILYIGPIMAAIPALMLSMMPDTPSILLIGLLYIGVQVIDAFVFTPVFLGKATDLSPLTVVMAVLIGAQLMGILGIVLAIPISATFKVLLVHYYLDRRKTEEANHTGKT